MGVFNLVLGTNRLDSLEPIESPLPHLPCRTSDVTVAPLAAEGGLLGCTTSSLSATAITGAPLLSTPAVYLRQDHALQHGKVSRLAGPLSYNSLTLMGATRVWFANEWCGDREWSSQL